MNSIEVIDLCYSYEDGTKALDHVNMTIHQGKTTAILGGNGAGKSTLFLTLNGVLKPKSGQVLLEGKTINYSKKDLIEIRGKIGIVFQDPDDQLFSASVRKDISFGILKQGYSQDEAEEKIKFVVEKLGLEDIIDKNTHALSFGQKKRVAIAGVLVMNPSVIILDEPTAGLDPRGVSEILQLLEEIKNTMGITIIISTHDIDLVPLYCEEVILMNGGRVIYSGTPEDLFSKPQLIRDHSLRLPRINHLMGILKNKDHLDVNPNASTISEARRSIKELFEQG